MNSRWIYSILVRLTIFQNYVFSYGLPHYTSVFMVILGEDIHLHTKRAILNVLSPRCNIRFYVILAWLFGLLVGLHIIPSLFPTSNWQLNLKAPLKQSFPLPLALSFLLISATLICLHCNKLFFLPMLCLLRSVFFGFSLFLVSNCFASGAWLAVVLYLFSDAINICLLLWFWLRHSVHKNYHLSKDTAIYIGAVIVAASFDYFFLTPFLQKIY